MSGAPETTEARLRDALGALAETVPVSEDAYRGVQARWRQRERRRRRVAAVVAAAAILLADGVGLWALNRADVSPHVVFDSGDQEPGVTPEPLGQP